MNTRARLLRAAVGFALVPPTEPELRLVHRWLDSWRGVGDIVAAMALLSILVTGSCAPPSAARGDGVSIERAVEIARHEVLRRRPNIGELTFEADEGNTRWQRYKASIGEVSEEIRSVEARLGGREYWAVYAAPKPIPGYLRGGGDVFFFIEKASGRVIAVLEGR